MKFSGYWKLCVQRIVCDFLLQQLAQVHECMNKLSATLVAIIFLLFHLVCAKICNEFLYYQLGLCQKQGQNRVIDYFEHKAKCFLFFCTSNSQSFLLSGKAGSSGGWQRAVTFDPWYLPSGWSEGGYTGIHSHGGERDLMIPHPTSLKDPSEVGKKERILESGLSINFP